MGLFGKSRKTGREETKRLVKSLVEDLDESEIRYLEVLRRELGNIIVAEDPDLMVRSYEKAWTWERETAKDPARLYADEQALTAKIALFKDYDIVAKCHFVPYAEVLDMTSIENIVERYLETSRMLVFLKNRSPMEAIRTRPVHDEREYKTMLNVVQVVKDRGLRDRIDDALRRYRAYRHGFDAGKGEHYAGLHATFSDAQIEVFQIPYHTSPDNETGIVFKDTGEFGVYATFYDHGRDKTYRSYYRSDEGFKKREPLVPR